MEQTESRLTALEIKMTYLEDFVHQMQEVAVENAREIDALKRKNQTLEAKIEELLENEEIPNRRPPHY